MHLNIVSSYPPVLDGFFEQDATYYVLYGGRGSGKSWSVATYLIEQALTAQHRILCAREIQLSIKHSVKKLLVDTMIRMGCRTLFKVLDQSILCPITGTEFIFTGLWNNEETIKSMTAITITWIEEAQSVSHVSMVNITPTVLRTPDAKIIMTMNPRYSTDWIYENFIKPKILRDDAVRLKVNYAHNPWFGDSPLKKEEEVMRAQNPGLHSHVWLGELNLDDDALVFKGNVSCEEFDTPDDAQFMFGQDYGFSQDPMAFVRSFLSDDGKTLYVDQESGGMTRLDLFDHPDEMDKLDGARQFPIIGDSARPEYVDWLRRQGFAITGTEKYKGSVEDGVAWLQSVTIVVHPRCRMTHNELRLYKFERHKQTEEILRKPEDKNNHFIDALRYAWQSRWMKRKIRIGVN